MIVSLEHYNKDKKQQYTGSFYTVHSMAQTWKVTTIRLAQK